MANQTDNIQRGLTIVAEETSDNTKRIPRAMSTITDNTIGLQARGSGGDTSGNSSNGGISDPTFAGVGRRDPARNDRRRINQLVQDMLDASRRLTAILDRYDPPAALQSEMRGSTVTTDTMWCPNHLAHGHSEPRSNNRTHCRWCDDTKRTYGRLPNTRLIDAHYRTPRLSDADYRRLLDLKGVG